MFPLLPRMIFGLFYNTPIVSQILIDLNFLCDNLQFLSLFLYFQIWGCENSGLFHAFNRHILHRLNVTARDSVSVEPDGDGLVHVTVLARQTQHRRILNQQDLINALRKRTDISLKLVSLVQNLKRMVDFKKI